MVAKMRTGSINEWEAHLLKEHSKRVIKLIRQVITLYEKMCEVDNADWGEVAIQLASVLLSPDGSLKYKDAFFRHPHGVIGSPHHTNLAMTLDIRLTRHNPIRVRFEHSASLGPTLEETTYTLLRFSDSLHFWRKDTRAILKLVDKRLKIAQEIADKNTKELILYGFGELSKEYDELLSPDGFGYAHRWDKGGN